MRCVARAHIVAEARQDIYWRLLEKIAGSKLKLTKSVTALPACAEPDRHDAELLAAFRTDFPEYFEADYAALRKIDEDRMKSAEGKTRWRKFIAPFEKVIEDYNFGTLMRLDVAGEYTEANTIFGSLGRSGIRLINSATNTVPMLRDRTQLAWLCVETLFVWLTQLSERLGIGAACVGRRR